MKLRIRLIYSFLCGISFAYTQQGDSTSIPDKRPFATLSGLTAYYFWEEDANGLIDSGRVSIPYTQNRVVHLQPDRKTGNVSRKELTHAIQLLAQSRKWDPANHYRLYRLFHRDERRIIRSLQMHVSNEPGSVIYRRTANGWSSQAAGTVMYFEVHTDGKLTFLHASDTLRIPEWGIDVASPLPYTVYQYESGKRTTDSVQVFSISGENLSADFRQHFVQQPLRFLLFVNGYRGPRRDNDPGDGLVSRKDRYYYWYKIDDRFRSIMRPDAAFYLDGSFPIGTSNHRNRLRFGWSWLRTKLTCAPHISRRQLRRMNTNPNPEGFHYRVEQGRLGGRAFLLARQLNPFSDTIRDTLDIVCHSMGYAYTLGFLEFAASNLVLGNIYIMAPENASVAGYDWNRFQEVWQYGTDLDQPGADPLRQQDGIAPQTAVSGLERMPADRGGRVYFPIDWKGKNFVDSHMVYSYDWMFDCIPEGSPGFVHR